MLIEIKVLFLESDDNAVGRGDRGGCQRKLEHYEGW